MGINVHAGERAAIQPWVARTAVAASFAAAGIAMVYAAPAQIDDRLLTRWLFSWQAGMPSRALAGTMLQAAVGDVDAAAIYAAARAVQVTLIGAMSTLLAALVVDRDGYVSPGRALLALTVAVSAVGFPSIAAGVGLLDQVVILLAIGAGWAITSGRHWVAGGMLVLAVLVHEPALVMVGAWLGVFAWWRTGRASSSAVVVGPALAAAAVMAALSPAADPDQMVAALSAGTEVNVHTRPVEAQYWGLVENFRYTVRFVAVDGTHLIVGSVLAVVPVAAALLHRGWRVRLAYRDRVLLAASAVPLVLAPIAVDWGRWFGMAAVLAAVSLLLADDGRTARRGEVGWLVAVAAAAWFTGPVVSHAWVPGLS